MTKQRKLIHNIIVVLAFTIFAFSGKALAASSGTVTGTIKFYQHQGNYCPTSRSCTGAKYPQSQYHTNRPIKKVKVFIRRNSDSTIIGQGSTNSSGYFSIAWSDPAASGNVVANYIWRGEESGDRFRLETTSGGYWIFWTSSFTLTKSATTSTGTKTWGNSSSPHFLANLYDGASMMWINSLGQSNRMTDYFTGVKIRAYDAAACPTSCANGPDNRIIIDSENSAISPQGRIMHEMGHIASYRASRDQSYHQIGMFDYCYPSTGGGCTWSLNTAEHASVHFEEGAATHLGDVGLYSANATAPHTCLSSGACATNSFNIETSLGTSCGTNVNRQPINAIRYFWDNYDSLVDYTGENLNRGVWEVVDTIHAFDNGTSNTLHVKDEPWNSSYTSLDDRDGRSCIDFRENWKTWGTDSSVQLSNNCGSAGD